MKPGVRRFASPALLRGSTGDAGGVARPSLAGRRGVCVKPAPLGVQLSPLQLGQDLPTGATGIPQAGIRTSEP